MVDGQYLRKPQIWCKLCNGYGHKAEDCPTKVKVKKPWVKPKLTVWRKAEVFTPCSQEVVCEQSVNKSCEQVESVNTVCEQPVNKSKEELRKEYRREWMRKKREQVLV